MKKIVFVFAAFVAFFESYATIHPTASAQVSGDASAVIVTPLELNKVADLKFGNISAGPVAGAVVLTTDDVRSSNGGVTLIATGNESNAASFDVNGAPDATFTIVLPLSIFIYSNGDKMEVIDFVSNRGDSSVLSNEGIANVKVGATLIVGANQTPGLYEGKFDMTVAYN